MKISADTSAAPLLLANYPQTAGVYDEMSGAGGVLRPHWDTFIGSLTALGGEELARRWRTARQRIRENGVTYNVYGDPLGVDRPWSLDAIPLLIPPSEWAQLEAGLIQRARLLNEILADLYGPQQLLRGGHIPPALVFANPGFLAAVSRYARSGQHVPAPACGRSGALARWAMVGALGPYPGALGRGLCAREPHRAGGNVSGLVPRVPGQTGRFIFSFFSRHAAAPVAIAAATIPASSS